MEPGNVLVSTVPKMVMYPPLSYYDMWASALGFHHLMHTPSTQKQVEIQINGTELVSEIDLFIRTICLRTGGVTPPIWCSLYISNVRHVLNMSRQMRRKCVILDQSSHRKNRTEWWSREVEIRTAVALVYYFGSSSFCSLPCKNNSMLVRLHILSSFCKCFYNFFF